MADGEMQVMNDELTVFNFGDKTFELREMKIKRTKKLSELMFKLQAEAINKVKDKKADELVGEEFTQEISSGVNKILDFIFRIEEGPPLGRGGEDWLDLLSFRQIEMIINEIVRQSKVDWLAPFFTAFSQPLKMIILPKIELPESQDPSGSPIT